MRQFGAAPPPPTLFERLKEGLAKSAGTLGLSDILKKKLDAETVEALEKALIRADLGVGPAHEIAAAVARGRYDEDVSPAELRKVLAGEIARILRPIEKPFVVNRAKKPFVVLVAGVNGTGKTTTIGKIAAKLVRDGQKVVLAAGDTFRAAAIEQLQIWGKRAGAEVFARAPGSDAAGLVFDALLRAHDTQANVLLIDTAGRLQNKAGLMAELEKIARVLKKQDADAPHAVLLVLDATTGQNAVAQVEAFAASVPLTGLVMTKLDGTAKGGILVALAARFALPVYFIGVGEREDDLQPFVAETFAKALTGGS
ncbi:MAG: signal recognition particle-docking protein FtsY [Alphaproteobacteria bacterium]|nr:signal recognition particle-docking protein FtsY [Alphaproteobacteria bacterium]MDE2630686.1 signal recognition particle-docking protein FtsY [Alphaproteobacteria bacterium]